MKRPLVSIVVTCYNYGTYLGEALESALSQSYENIEIIVINDGSTDETDTIVKSFGSKVRYLKQSNRGIVQVRNRGLKEASGEYLLFLDADDKIPPEYIESNVSFAEQYSLDIVSTDLILFGDGIDETRDVIAEYDIELIKHGNIIHISSLVRKEAIGDQRFDETLSKRSHEDWDFFLGLALKGLKIRKNSNTALYYRQHGSARNNHEISDKDKYKFAEVYRDILHKYTLLHPEQLYYLSSTRFANTIVHIKNDIITKMEGVIRAQNEKINELTKENEKIKISKEYIVGRKIVWLPRKTKALIKKIRR